MPFQRSGCDGTAQPGIQMACREDSSYSEFSPNSQELAVSADSSRSGSQESSPGNSARSIPGGPAQQPKSDLPPPVTGDREWNAASRKQRVSDFWALVGCNAIVFGASVCIMVLELTASRLIANYVGQSLYTWTSVIGVVLAGISIGNYLGGWLADKFPPQRVLPWLFVVSGLLTFSVLFLNGWAASTSRPDGMHWQLWVMSVVAWVFFLPALALGTVSPVTASIALRRSVKTGITVGNIYAWGALGSIVGTFLTGFWLIGAFGCREVIWVTSCILVIMGVVVATGQRAFRVAAVFGALQLIVQWGLFSSTTEQQMANIARVIAGIRSGWSAGDEQIAADEEAVEDATIKGDNIALSAADQRLEWRRDRRQAEDAWGKWGGKLGKHLHAVGLALSLRSDDPEEYNDESDYYSINISNARIHGDTVKQLRLDYLLHSYYNADNPTKLYYDYEQVYAAITERAASAWNRTTAAPLDKLPPGDEFATALPASVKFDADRKLLSVRGMMQVSDLRKLLSIGPYAAYWQAIITTWQEASLDWSKATRRTHGLIQTPLDELPAGVVFPDDLAVAVHYDTVFKSIICTRPFDLGELWRLLAQGPVADYIEAVRTLFVQSRRTSTLFIGGGGYVFPRWIESKFPDEPVIDVAEIDPAVKAAVESELGLATEYGSPQAGKTWVKTHLGDARKFVDDQVRANDLRLAAGKAPFTYDFVYGDAFNDLSVPWHLTTREFSTKVRKLLTPDQGTYLVNIIDIYPRAKYPDASDGSTALLRDPPPEKLTPAEWTTGFWTSAPEPFAALQLRKERNGDYRIGIRGVMTDDLRQKLLAEAGSDERWKRAIVALAARSRAERVGQFLGRYVRTARDVFPYVYVFTSNEGGDPGESRDTFIVACSLQPLSFDNLEDSGGHWKDGPFAWSETESSDPPHNFGDMTYVLELSRGKLLTDNYAPVDNLLAPVFVNRNADGD